MSFCFKFVFFFYKCIIFQTCLSMNRLLVNHLEAYLMFANKIFTMAIDSYKDEHHLFYNGIHFNTFIHLLKRKIDLLSINLYFSCFIFINSWRNND